MLGHKTFNDQKNSKNQIFVLYKVFRKIEKVQLKIT